MMYAICDFLKDILPTDAAKVQAWAAVGVLALTGRMAYYAKQALDTWRDQKHYDIYIDVKQKLHPYMRSFGKYLSRYRMVCVSGSTANDRLKQLLSLQEQWFEELLNLQIYGLLDLIEELPNIEKYEKLGKDFKFCKKTYDDINFVLLFATEKTFDFDDYSNQCTEKLKEISQAIY